MVFKIAESITIMSNLWYQHGESIWNEQAMVDVVKAWLANPQRLPPNLRYFRLVLKSTLGLELGPVSDEIRALGARVGVTVDISRPRRL